MNRSITRIRALQLVFVAGLAACDASDGGGGPDAPGAMSTTATVSWTIRRQGAATTCAAVGATELQIHARPENDHPEVFKIFECVLPPGTLPLAPGRYAISAELVGSGVFSEAPAKAITVPTTGAPVPVQFEFNL